MYDKSYFFVANPLNRYSISMRQNPKFNADGSLDLYVQNKSPGPDKEANWLPAPAGHIHPDDAALLAEPQSPSILDGSWTITARHGGVVNREPKRSLSPKRKGLQE